MILNEGLPTSLLTWGNETIVWREKERSRIGAVQMDNLRGLLHKGIIDKIWNAGIRVL